MGTVTSWFYWPSLHSPFLQGCWAVSFLIQRTMAPVLARKRSAPSTRTQKGEGYTWKKFFWILDFFGYFVFKSIYFPSLLWFPPTSLLLFSPLLFLFLKNLGLRSPVVQVFFRAWGGVRKKRCDGGMEKKGRWMPIFLTGSCYYLLLWAQLFS